MRRGARPVSCAQTGFHAKHQTYDAAGRTVETRFADVEGRPATNHGTAVRRFRYDNYDHQVEATSYDAAGEVTETLGVTTRRTLYDAAHRSFGIVLLDRRGAPARYRSCYVGATCPTRPWHAVRIVRGPSGLAEQNLFFDAAGQLLETMACRRVRCFR